MTNKTNFHKIQDFQTGVNGPVPSSPIMPEVDKIALWKKLVQEEYAEVMAEFDRLDMTDPTETAALMHELADLLYVVYGSFAIFGVDGDAVFAEVHNANMRKLGGERRADGKLLKPPDWKPANVKSVIEQLVEDSKDKP